MRVSIIGVFALAMTANINATEHKIADFPQLISPINIPETNLGDMKPSGEHFSLNIQESDKADNMDIWDVNTVQPRQLNAFRTPAGECMVKMDSTIRTLHSGQPITRQLMSYTDWGAPNRSDNYIITENNEWKFYSYFLYEFDNYQRLILKESICESEPYNNISYEYIYTSVGNNVATAICSTYSADFNDMMPYQKADYGYDDRGNCTLTIYYSWDYDLADWMPVMKETAEYDDQNRCISFMIYIWQPESSEWAGSVNPTDKSMKVEYTTDGQEAIVREYRWENDAWLEYYNRITTYDDKGRKVRYDRKYWNREKQNWDGGDRYGGSKVQNNVYILYDYDDKDRCLYEDAYQFNSKGEAKSLQKYEYEYTDYDNGIYDVLERYYSRWESSTPSLYSEYLYTFDSNNRRYLYEKQWVYYNGLKEAYEETIYYHTEDGYYIGKERYKFDTTEENKRYGQFKEWHEYADDWDHSAYTPIGSYTYYGNGYDDETWILDSKAEYRWDNNVLASATSYKDVRRDGNVIPYYSFDTEFDFSIPISNVWMWPLDKREEYRLHKVNKALVWQDLNADGEWDSNASYIDTYYYSDVTSTAINATDVDSNKVEIARYDVTGKLLNSPVKGINILKYSDGSVSKVMVK